MPSQEYMDKMQVRQNYRNLWHTDLTGAIQADTTCKFGLAACIAASPFSANIVVFYLLFWPLVYPVLFMMAVDHVHHTCFGSELFTMICQDMCAVLVICPVVAGVERVDALNFAFALRVCVCVGLALHVHCMAMKQVLRARVASLHHAGFMFCLQQLACIFSIVAMIVGSDEISEASQILSCLADIVYCTVCACMQTQHKVEMDKRDGMFGSHPMAVPPPQQMSRLDQPYPPNVGYAPQPYGYPPPPQAQGYPPAGYPSSGYQR
ncbi:hypothetical protein RJ640_018937 [Escallonia rubra]|uniref:Uncharacterized protein n=1 Tax=Escallonia rubra TaxID=112253 RepID=A0AA88R8B5_9ASTE|nr:hypothetical protein RJ640_018937 [Escallonia rubra]